MLYILKDDGNQVCAVSDKRLSNEWEPADMEDKSLKLFLQNNPGIGTEIMQSSDADFIRVLEDVIDLLIDKQVVQFTEFPDAVQKNSLIADDIAKACEAILIQRGYLEITIVSSEWLIISVNATHSLELFNMCYWRICFRCWPVIGPFSVYFYW